MTTPSAGTDFGFRFLGDPLTHTFTITPGRHEWRLWRPHLYEFAQLLFRDR